jgi:hypothetical protein
MNIKTLNFWISHKHSVYLQQNMLGMKKLATFLVLVISVTSCSNNSNTEYSNERDDSHSYYVESEGYTSFYRYMWDEGFPDTIIVKFTRNGIFEGYVEAYRADVIKDSFGTAISPAYYFRDVVGHTWVYDLHGKFVAFHESTKPHSTSSEEPQYKP